MSKPIPKSVLEKVDKLLTNVSVIWDFVADLKDIRHHFIPLIQEKFIQEHEFLFARIIFKTAILCSYFSKVFDLEIGSRKRQKRRK